MGQGAQVLAMSVDSLRPTLYPNDATERVLARMRGIVRSGWTSTSDAAALDRRSYCLYLIDNICK